jgi:class 3 adenylate cyclase
LPHLKQDRRLQSGMDRNATQEALSRRERQIAGAYADGSSFRQIAQRLFIAPTTVRTHLRTIYRKLGVTSKIELLRAIDELSSPTVANDEPPEVVRPVGDRSAKRQVTVLSVTIDGLADLAMRLDPEDMTGLVASLRNIVAESTSRGGAQLLPSRDAEIGACFGVPASSETDAERAVLCALDIRDRVTALATPGGVAMAARIGLFTGPVVVRGSAPASEDVTGAAPYLAAALARAATGGGIVVCARTRAMLGGLFGVSDLGPVHVDGGQESVRSFTVA